MLGDLSQVSLSKIMRAVDRQQKTGLLSIWGDEGVYRIAFDQGQIKAAISPNPNQSLQQSLVARGIESDAISQAMRDCPESCSLGDYLCKHQGLKPLLLNEIFQQQIEQACFPLFMLTAGQFRFSQHAPLPHEEMTGISASSLEIALEGLRRMTASASGLERLPKPDCLLKRVEGELPSLPLSNIEKNVWKHLASQRRLKDVSRYILASLIDVRQAALHLLELQIIQQIPDERLSA